MHGTLMHSPEPERDVRANSIPQQYTDEAWDWVIVNGDGNDLLFGCACVLCEKVIEGLISKDARKGQIPELSRKIRNDRSKVLYFGYLRSSGLLTPIEHCKSVGGELETRIVKLAESDEGTTYASIQNIVTSGDSSSFGLYRIHPSHKSSRAIAQKVSKIMRMADNENQ